MHVRDQLRVTLDETLSNALHAYAARQMIPVSTAARALLLDAITSAHPTPTPGQRSCWPFRSGAPLFVRVHAELRGQLALIAQDAPLGQVAAALIEQALVQRVLPDAANKAA